MSMYFNNGQELLDVLSVSDPKEAEELKHLIFAAYQKQQILSQEAEAEVAGCRQVCDDNKSMMTFLNRKSVEISAQLKDALNEDRVELYALRQDYAFADQAERIQKLRNTLAHVDQHYDFIATVKKGADEVSHLDAVERYYHALAIEASRVRDLQHVTTVASLGAAFESEGGALGIIGKQTEIRKAEAARAWKQYESARDEARTARARYEQQQSALASKGLITSRNVR